jgi:hypothetical protein
MDLRKGTIFSDVLDKHTPDKISLLNMRQDKSRKELVLDSLCHNVIKSSELRDILEYVIEEKTKMFESEHFKGCLYEGEEYTLDLILPSVRRAWVAFFITPPILLKEKRLEFFQLLFDIDEFLDYFVNIFPKVKDSLMHFESLDRSVETVTLVVDNYVASRIEVTISTKDIDSDIRDIKIKKTLKNI